MAALALSLSRPARGAEVQVPFDAAGRIQRVDEALARRIGMFVDRWPGFQEARLFAAEDSTFVLEITVVRGGALAREREILSAERADALRREVAGKVATLAPIESTGSPQEGRPVLLAGASLLGLGFYGWAIPVAGNFDDAGLTGGGYLLTAGASFFVPFLLTQNAPVSWGMTNLALAGATRGIAHGYWVHDVLMPKAPDDEFRSRVTTMMITSVVEGAGGYLWASAARLDAGTAQTIVNGADFGLVWGLSAAAYSIEDFEGEERDVAVMALTGVAAGTIGGRILAGRRAYSYGDANVMRTAGSAGLLLGVAFGDLGDPQESGPYDVGMITGSLVGLAVGDRLVAHRDFTAGQGLIVALGGGAGSLLGLGAALTIAGTEGDHSSAYWFGTALGHVLGLTVTYASQAPSAVRRASERSSWRFEIAPEGLLAAQRGDSRRQLARPLVASARDGRRAESAETVPALLRVRATF